MDRYRLFGDLTDRWDLCLDLVFWPPLSLDKSPPLLDTILVKKETFSRLTLAAIEAGLQAGEILRQGFGTSFQIHSKEGKHNLVTEYDYKAEKAIIATLNALIPGSRFLAEESGFTGVEEELVWIIDPLDGTVNFAHHIPIFSVSIAVEKQGELLSGIVYQPLQNELFIAEKGKGAYLYRPQSELLCYGQARQSAMSEQQDQEEIGDSENRLVKAPASQNMSILTGMDGKSIHISPISSLEQSILATGFPYNLSENPFHCIDHFIDIVKLGIPIRRLGSAAIDLAYTAAGYFEGFFEVGLAPWDCAAGLLLIQEAGGKVTHWDNTPFSIHSRKPIIATNGHIHEEIAAILHRKC